MMCVLEKCFDLLALSQQARLAKKKKKRIKLTKKSKITAFKLLS